MIIFFFTLPEWIIWNVVLFISWQDNMISEKMSTKVLTKSSVLWINSSAWIKTGELINKLMFHHQIVTVLVFFLHYFTQALGLYISQSSNVKDKEKLLYPIIRVWKVCSDQSIILLKKCLLFVYQIICPIGALRLIIMESCPSSWRNSRTAFRREVRV